MLIKLGIPTKHWIFVPKNNSWDCGEYLARFYRSTFGNLTTLELPKSEIT